MPSFLPYIVTIDESEHEINYETELAIAYLQAMNDDEPILDLVKTYYPFKVFEIEKERRVFDLLGHNESEVPLLVINDIIENIKELAKAENKDRISHVKKCKKLLKNYHIEPRDVKNLVDEIEIVNYLFDSEKITNNQTVELFQSIVTEEKFHEIMKDLEKTRKNTVAILNASFKARRSLQSFKDKIDKEYEKEYKPLLNDSEKILKSLIKKQCKEMDELEKEHNKVVNEIIKEIDIKISEKLDEYDKIIKEADQDTEEEKRVLKHEQALNKLNKAIKKLEKERKNKVDSEKQKIMSKKKKFRKEFEKTKHRGIKKLEKVDKKHKPLKSELAELFEIQNKIVSELEEEEKTLSLLINLDYVKGEDILVPFYVYRKRDKFGFLPPTKTVGEKGSSFLIMSLIKNSLADKINEQVSPSTMAFNKYFDMVIDTLNNNSTLSQKYKETISELDLLDVRENLVSLIVGLYRLYDWGWINDKEYLLAQTQVVEKIANPINIGNSEISSEQPIETVKQTT